MPLRILITGFLNMRYSIGKWNILLPANSINRLKLILNYYITFIRRMKCCFVTDRCVKNI